MSVTPNATAPVSRRKPDDTRTSSIQWLSLRSPVRAPHPNCQSVVGAHPGIWSAITSSPSCVTVSPPSSYRTTIAFGSMSIPPRIFEPMNVELTTEPLYATSISP